MGATLSHDGWLYRYRLDDGFGRPEVAFVLCTFWMVEALAATGRSSDARATMERVRAAMSPLGLIAEDYSPATGRMWGNFPQAYSHAGLIHGVPAALARRAEELERLEREPEACAGVGQRDRAAVGLAGTVRVPPT